MWHKVVIFGVLSVLVMVTHAAPSAEEIALRKAILSTGPSTYTLTKNIILSGDLPPLPDQKVLTVQSAKKSGAPFKIDGQNKYKIFRYSQSQIVKLTLNNIVLTRSPIAVDIYGVEPDGNPPYNFIELRASKVKFIGNAIALQLNIVNAFIDNCEFTGQRQTAIQIRSEEGLGDSVRITSTTFSKNAGAISVGKYSSIIVDKSKFDQNKAQAGGAIYVDRGRAEVTNSQFTKNVATTGGGAVYLTDAGFSGRNLVFKGNVANTEGGGAVYLRGFTELQDGSVADFTSTLFIDNISLNKRGGAFVLNDNCAILFCQATFLRNLGRRNEDTDGYVLGSNNFLSYPDPFGPIVLITAGAQLSPGTATCT